MKRLKKLTYDQKKRLSKKGFDATQYLYVKSEDGKWIFAKKDNYDETISINIPK